MSYFIRLLMFCSSYVPLILIFSIRNYDNYRYFTISGIIVSILLTIILLLVMIVFRQLGRATITLSKINYKSSDLFPYMFSYVLPFLNLNLGSYMDLITIGIFFIMLAAIYINSNMIHINPMLSLFGYKIFEVIDTNNNAFVLITREQKLPVGITIDVRNLGSNVIKEVK